MTAPSYKGLASSSDRATKAARGASRKNDTKCELLLRRALWHRGLRYRNNVASLPGKPDVVFRGARVAVFVDGDFWHGRNWETRRAKLEGGANASYWVAKVQRNMERDLANTAKLEALGWRVMRFWEGDVLGGVDGVAEAIRDAVNAAASPDGK